MIRSNTDTRKISSQKHFRFPSAFNRSNHQSSFTYVKNIMNSHFRNNSEKEIVPCPSRTQSMAKLKTHIRYSGGNSSEKLQFGRIAKPNVMISHEIRHNPLKQKKPISENLILERGLLEVINMGLLPKNINFTEILNKKYEVVQNEEKELEKENKREFFATNPQIYRDQREQSEYKHRKILFKVKNRKIKSMNPFKTRKPQILIFNENKTILKIINQKIEKNEDYHLYFLKMKANGNDVIFRSFINKMEKFARKYRLYKFQFHPIVDETRKMSDSLLHKQIVNNKILGIYKAMQGGKEEHVKNSFKMVVSRLLYKRALRDLNKIQDIKRYYMIKKYYEKMAIARTQFLIKKFRTFSEKQMKLKNNSFESFSNEIHIIALKTASVEHQNTFYKLRQRNNIQLTRLFSKKPKNLVILLNEEKMNINPWLKSIYEIPGYHPQIQIVRTFLPKHKSTSIDEIYYGFKKKSIRRIKILNKSEKPILIPSSFTASVTKICELLDLSLFGGNFVLEDRKKLLEMDFESLQASNYGRSQIQRLKMKQIFGYKISNLFFDNKIRTKKFFINNSCKIPYAFFHSREQNEDYFFRKLSEIIITEKYINTWVFKIGKQKFSRGLGFLQTDSIKILKEKKKKNQINEEDVDDVYKFIKPIIYDKLFLPQSSLYDRFQFMEAFFNESGFVEEYVEDCECCCVFGMIQTNGQFQFLGSYRKIYTNQKVNCAAFYPATEITPQILLKVKEISSILYEKQEIMGHITFEFLFHQVEKQFYFLDIIPSLEQYSSIYSMYSAYFSSFLSEMKIFYDFQVEEKKFSPNSLPKTVLYCPFIDNNGNRFESIKEFEKVCLNKKLTLNLNNLEGIKFLYLNLNEELPDCLSIFCLGSDEKSALKYCLEGLNFLSQAGNKVNKFDKKAQRSSRTDCLYMNDVLWRLRQVKKNLDFKIN